MNAPQDRVLLVTGALAVGVFLVGWAAVEANTGPFEHDLEAASSPAELSGTYTVNGGSASSPLCGSEPTGQLCEPETVAEITVEGLPASTEIPLAAWLVDAEGAHALGTLEDQDGVHRLSATEVVDGDAYERLVVGLADPEAPDRIAFPLHEEPLPTSGGETRQLSTSFDARIAPVEGSLSLAQIGAVEVAVTASATVEGLPRAEGWTYATWLVDEDTSAWTSLGVLEHDGDAGSGHLDARVERVTLADQERFVVTLEPAGVDARAPVGFPLAEAGVQAQALFGG